MFDGAEGQAGKLFQKISVNDKKKKNVKLKCKSDG